MLQLIFFKGPMIMNSSLNTLIKLIILIIILLIGLVALFFVKIIDFDNLKKDEHIESIQKDAENPSEDRIKKINDSLNQREERIKALKEVGKQLGG
jgi:hypothetical protein